MTPTDPPNRKPTDPDAGSRAGVADVAAHMSAATASSLPLTAGLRAAAEDDVSRPLARALRQLAERLERGVPFDDAIQELHAHAPRRARAMLLAAKSGHDFASILTAILGQERAENARRKELRQALAYPALLMLLTYVVFLGIYFLVLPIMHSVFSSQDSTILDEMFRWSSWNPFSNEEPWDDQGLVLSVRSAYRLHLFARWLLLAVGIALLVVPLTLRVILGGSQFGRLVHKLPLVGPLWFYSQIASWSELLAVLLHAQLPLPEALRLTATACHVSLEPATRAAAESVERGKSLPLALSAAGAFPASLALFCGSTKSGTPLPEVVERAGEAFRQRYRHRVELVTAIARPIAFLIVVVAVATMISFITRSGIDLIRYLS